MVGLEQGKGSGKHLFSSGGESREPWVLERSEVTRKMPGHSRQSKFLSQEAVLRNGFLIRSIL